MASQAQERAEPNERPRAANELTISDWDPVSKQPLFKLAAVRIRKLAEGDGSAAPAPTTTASEPVVAAAPATVGGSGVRETLEKAER